MKSYLFKLGAATVVFAAFAFNFPQQKDPRGNKPSPEEVMKNLDADKNGLISFEEARAAEKGHLYRKFGAVDANKDGNITLAELENGKRGKPEPSELIKKFDLDQNGTISFDEARTASEGKLYRVFGAMDANRDGVLEATELESFEARVRRGKNEHRGRPRKRD